MTRSSIAAVLALCLGFALAKPAQAQAPDDGFHFPPQAAAADPEPINPSVKSLDSGRLMIVVGSAKRNFGYHIGELIPVTIVVSADKNVQVNLDALKRKTLTSEPTDFELVGSPLIVKEERGGKTIWRIQLLLRSWVVKQPPATPILVLSCEFHYATEMLPDGKTPNWKPITTPDFGVEISNTATDASKNLLEGELELKQSPKPALVRPLKIAGCLLISLLPVWLLMRLWRRIRPRRKLTSAEMAWAEFDAVLASKEESGRLSYEQYARVSGTLRRYLRIDSVPSTEVAAPLGRFFAQNENKAEMLKITASALAKLDRALYSKVELTDSEELVLLSEIEQIVPRP